MLYIQSLEKTAHLLSHVRAQPEGAIYDLLGTEFFDLDLLA